MPYYNIAVARPLGKIFTYSYTKKLKTGLRVSIPLGTAKAFGFVIEEVGKPDFDTKEILNVSYIEYFSSYNYKIYKWISEYYHYPIGELLKFITPSYSPSDKVLKKINKNIESQIETNIKDYSLKLNEEQKEALRLITKPQTYMLHGVTGSGKTEVYIEYAKKIIKKGKSVIILVPEIALTPQTLERISKYFDGEIAIIHSGLTPKEKFVNWQSIKSNKAKLILGVRSAIFSPIKNLGLVVVDEEHDSSYKQSDRLKYNTRDIAVMMGQKYNIPIILASATPSVESYYHAYKGKYKYLTLKNNIYPVNKSIQILDLKKEKHKTSNITETLYESIKLNIDNKKQVLLFLNRRGFSRSIICKDCGEVFSCPNCSIPLTVHRNLSLMKCHYCAHERKLPDYCYKCGSHNLISIGTGTEKLEIELKELFPDAKIKRVDSDILKGKNAISEFISNINEQNIDIIVGTQIVIKGHDFKNIGLVGIINADLGLQIPDFRSSELGFQQIVQVNGRTGRHQDGLVIAQTYMPEHFSIEYALNNNIIDFYKKELQNRHELLYPPYSKIADLKISSSNLANVKKYSNYIREELEKISKNKLIILGPAPSPIEKINTRYRYHILLKAKNSQLIQDTISKLEKIIKKPSKELRFSIDIDPYSLI